VVTTPDVGKTKPEAPKIEVPPYSPPANAVQFVNSNANLTGKLAEHYVDFSFYYPGWLAERSEGWRARRRQLRKGRASLTTKLYAGEFCGWLVFVSRI